MTNEQIEKEVLAILESTRKRPGYRYRRKGTTDPWHYNLQNIQLSSGYILGGHYGPDDREDRKMIYEAIDRAWERYKSTKLHRILA